MPEMDLAKVGEQLISGILATIALLVAWLGGYLATGQVGLNASNSNLTFGWRTVINGCHTWVLSPTLAWMSLCILGNGAI